MLWEMESVLSQAPGSEWAEEYELALGSRSTLRQDRRRSATGQGGKSARTRDVRVTGGKPVQETFPVDRHEGDHLKYTVKGAKQQPPAKDAGGCRGITAADL